MKYETLLLLILFHTITTSKLDKLYTDRFVSNVVSELLEDQLIARKVKYTEDIEHLPDYLKSLVSSSLLLMKLYKSNIEQTHNHLLSLLVYIFEDKNMRLHYHIVSRLILSINSLLRILIDDKISVNTLKRFIYIIIDIDNYFDVLTRDRNNKPSMNLIFKNIFNIYYQYDLSEYVGRWD